MSPGLGGFLRGEVQSARNTVWLIVFSFLVGFGFALGALSALRFMSPRVEVNTTVTYAAPRSAPEGGR